MSDDIVTKTRWTKGNDAFLGRVVYIQHLTTHEAEKWAGFESKQKDYVAHLVNLDAKYGYQRHFLKKNRQGEVCVPCDRLADGAVIEVRIGGDREYFRCDDGGLVRIDEAAVRTCIAMWRFATGQPLHEGDDSL